MKKTIIFLFFAFFFTAFVANAQTATTSIDPAIFSDYVGKYKFKDSPFEEIIVSVKDGKLYGEAVGQGSAELAPTKDTTKENEIFEIVGYGGTVKIVRDLATNKVVKVQMNVQGNSIEGEKIE